MPFIDTNTSITEETYAELIAFNEENKTPNNRRPGDDALDTAIHGIEKISPFSLYDLVQES